MAGATIDHLIATTFFVAAILIFVGLFNQTIQTAILFQRHRYLANRCSDLLDNILLNPGTPSNETIHWGKSNGTPTSLGLQDPEFSGYRLSPFSLMRLNSATGPPLHYSKTGLYYCNVTAGFAQFLLIPYDEIVNYSIARTLLGISNTYGFQLSITPIITVSVTETRPNPLRLAVYAMGTGSPLSNANISYCLITVEADGAFPAYSARYGAALADSQGSILLDFPDIDGTQESYVLIAYAQLSGLIGMGYYEHVTHDSSYVIPLVSDFDKKEIAITHSYDVQGHGDSAEVSYNATFLLLTEDFTLREMPLSNCTGKINSGMGQPYYTISIPTDTPGILLITYKKSPNESGVVLMPWGLSSLAFSVAFGENPLRNAINEWVATDVRQVIVNDIAYQAKLGLWSLEGYPVVS